MILEFVVEKQMTMRTRMDGIGVLGYIIDVIFEACMVILTSCHDVRMACLGNELLV
jgi:hypothetical protein